MDKILTYFRILRVKQWIKNAFIFFPLIFAGRVFEIEPLMASLQTFAGFCLIASSLYILNDYFDAKSDRLHPKKSQRLFAKLEINTPFVFYSILILMAFGLWILTKVNAVAVFPAIFYILINLGYNLYTKKIVILDVIFIAAGFQIRIWAGSLATGITASVWLQLCVFLLALFLGFTKRRHEISTLRDKAPEHRSVLAHYTAYLLDQIVIICSTLAIVFYGLYTISPEITQRLGNQKMVYSVVFVIYGIFRYLYLVHVKKLGDEPSEVLFSDIPLLICILSWMLYISYLIYLPHLKI